MHHFLPVFTSVYIYTIHLHCSVRHKKVHRLVMSWPTIKRELIEFLKLNFTRKFMNISHYNRLALIFLPFSR